MKIKSTPKWPFAIGALVTAVLGSLYLVYHFQIWPFIPTPTTSNSTAAPNTVDYSKPTDSQKDAGVSIKESVADKDKKSSDITAPTPQAPVPITITSTNRNGDILYIRTLISVVSSEGTCTLKMSGPNGKVYSATSGVQAVASSSTCQGFNVAISSLSVGTWNIAITYSNGGQSSIASKEVTL